MIGKNFVSFGTMYPGYTLVPLEMYPGYIDTTRANPLG